VVETGAAAQVFGSPLHPYAAALSAAFPRVGDPAARFAPSGLPGDPPDPAELPQGCVFAPRCPHAVDACRDTDPPLERYPDGRRAACLRIGEMEPVG
jgi:peptide/nickel transport system ATP-binding protein